MTRGSDNEDSVHMALRNLPYVNNRYDIRLMADSERSGSACSADGIALLNMKKIAAPSEWSSNKSLKDENGNTYAVSILQIKTRLSDASVNEVTQFIRSTPYVYNWNAQQLRPVVPNDHLCQLLDQCFILHVNMALYVCASETAILYCAAIHVPDYLVTMAQ